jgi:alkanesulfonate monooxygenase SsuD/methylene tetrahydromethanopterin reductase-like flavin-dependent oxidoreductase (luciferase family)
MVEGQEGVEWEQWLALAEAAEAAGLDALFRSDHYRSIVRGEPAGALDAWATLAALAARTERLRLGTLVSPVTFRAAAVLAKNAVTVDRISRGRVELGVGAGWYEAEHEAYGLPFPSLRERLDELDRQLTAIRLQLGETNAIRPRPAQERLPIVIGGRGKPRTVRAALEHADEYNLLMPSVDEARALREALDRAAAERGRTPLRLSLMAGCVVGADRAEAEERLAAWRAVTRREDAPPFAGTVDEVAEALSRFAAVGVERAMLQHLVHEDVEMVGVLGRLAAAVG